MTGPPMTKAPEESMSEKAEHTPLPWRVGDYSLNIFPVNGSGAICKFDSIHGMYSNFEANAALIVRSVNSLPYLVEVLEALQLQALQSSVNDPANEWGQEALAMTRAALSKYRGERG